MTGSEPEPQSDEWSNWLLHLRHAGDPEHERAIRAELERCADRVLDGAQLAPGMTLADIGAGDGLIAFSAIDRIGPSLRVVLTDISRPLLRHVERRATQRGIRGQCSFQHCNAENLTSIDNASIDVVTTRAVLAYVSDKSAAFREFHRVLKPGGRISIAEPVLRDEAVAVSALKIQLDARPIEQQEPLIPLLHRWKAAQFPDTAEKISKSPITNYSERDLVRFAQEGGFAEIHMEFHIDVSPHVVTSWEVFIGSSPHPWAPPLSVILTEQFTPEERQIFEQAFRPMVGAPGSTGVSRIAYLVAKKPLE
jgi:ubiquinone/menaquinone biosynthesis C-methylase UbiE